MNLGRWLRDHPRILESAYRLTQSLFVLLDPLFRRIGYDRAERLLQPVEDWGKRLVFDCRVCGQCILHSTGMTCPMTCPKNLRNGPCGGVRPDGYCEVLPAMRCIWVEAIERAGDMHYYGQELLLLQPPVNQRLEGSSAWINILRGIDREVPPGWAALGDSAGAEGPAAAGRYIPLITVGAIAPTTESTGEKEAS